MDDDDPIVLQRRASQLFRSGDVAGTISAYQRLLAVRPDLPNSWFNLGIVLRKAQRAEQALQAYANALKLQIDEPEEVHLQRGVIFSDDLSRPKQARAELDVALRLNPAYLPAWLNLGNLHEDMGDWTAARAAYLRALDLAPNNALALARLAGVCDEDGINEALLDRLRNVAGQPHATALDRADVGFALGAALDKTGNYSAAFAAYVEANMASREIAIAAGSRYDPAVQTALVDRIIAAFGKPVARDDKINSAVPLFVCGMFRSGSTLAERILARHDQVVAGGELDILPALIVSDLLPYPERAVTLSRPEIAQLRARYLANVESRHPAGTLLIDKRPDNFLHVGLIKKLFPDARFVQTIRAPRDTILSVFFLHADPALAYATDLSHIAQYQAEQQRLMDHWRTLYPEDIFVLDYDRLVADPRATIAPLLEFCGLPWDDAVLDHRKVGAAVRTASHRQVREPLYSHSSGRWRNYARHLDIIGDLL